MPAETILYIVSTLEKGGPVQQLYNLIKYLDRSRFKPQVLTLSPEPKNSLIEEFKRIDVSVSSLGIGRFASIFHGRKLIADYVSELNPAIIHSCGFRPDLFSARLERSARTVATLRNIPLDDYSDEYGWFGRFIMAPLHLKAIRKVGKPVTVSKTLSKKLYKRYGIPFFCIQNGADEQVFRPAADEQKLQIRKQLGLPLNNQLFISTGLLSKRKDPLCAAEGFLKADIKDATMIFAGDGPLREKLATFSGTGKIIPAGQITDIKPWLRASDFFISAAHSEGLPNAVLEAMACGLPCVLSDIEQHREILEYNPKAAVTFSPGSRQQLAKAIGSLTETPIEARKNAALEIIKNHLNARRMSKEYQVLYEQILGV